MVRGQGPHSTLWACTEDGLLNTMLGPSNRHPWKSFPTMRTEFSFDKSGWFRISELYVELATTYTDILTHFIGKPPVGHIHNMNENSFLLLTPSDQTQSNICENHISVQCHTQTNNPNHLKKSWYLSPWSYFIEINWPTRGLNTENMMFWAYVRLRWKVFQFRQNKLDLSECHMTKYINHKELNICQGF
jgi:hypothetical protein